MMSDFAAQLQERLSEFSAFCEGRSFSSCRLVHYCGFGQPGAIDVQIQNIRREITGCLEEGLLVAWEVSGDRLFLAVQEPGCPIPEWKYVFNEQAVVDEREMLRQAGFDDAV